MILLTNLLKIFGYNLLKEVIKLLTNRDRDYYEAPLNFLKWCYCKWVIGNGPFQMAHIWPILFIRQICYLCILLWIEIRCESFLIISLSVLVSISLGGIWSCAIVICAKFSDSFSYSFSPFSPCAKNFWWENLSEKNRVSWTLTVGGPLVTNSEYGWSTYNSFVSLNLII